MGGSEATPWMSASPRRCSPICLWRWPWLPTFSGGHVPTTGRSVVGGLKALAHLSPGAECWGEAEVRSYGPGFGEREEEAGQ